MRNNPRLLGAEPYRGRRCGRCGRGASRRGGGGDVLGDGLVCVFHGERVAGGLGWGEGARVRVGGERRDTLHQASFGRNRTVLICP